MAVAAASATVPMPSSVRLWRQLQQQEEWPKIVADPGSDADRALQPSTAVVAAVPAACVSDGSSCGSAVLPAG